MTVEELRAKLSGMPDHYLVVVDSGLQVPPSMLYSHSTGEAPETARFLDDVSIGTPGRFPVVVLSGDREL